MQILSPNCKSAKRLKGKQWQNYYGPFVIWKDYILKHHYPNMVTALVAFTSATREQIKEADQIGMKMYSWNDFLKVVGTILYLFAVHPMKSMEKSVL
jgi:long-chain acyl-CoA synthetase